MSYHQAPLLLAAILLAHLAAVGNPGCASTEHTRTTPMTTHETERGFLARSLDLDGQSWRYVVYVPRDIDLAKPAPVLVFLNGRGECGRDGWKHVAVGLGPAVMFNPDRWPFIIVFPQKPDQTSAWEDHTAMVMAALHKTRAEFNTDTARTYLTGLSQGGNGTWTIAAANPGVFAAIAPVCGYGNPETIAAGLTTTPVWAFHGERDDVVLPEESKAIVAALKQRNASPEPKLTLFPLANHNSWDPAYGMAELPAWLLSHRLPE